MFCCPPRETIVRRNDDDNDEFIVASISNIRTHILQIGGKGGELCIVLSTNHTEELENDSLVSLVSTVTSLLKYLRSTINLLDTSLVSAIGQKMIINNRKYPAAMVKGSLDKYTNYSHYTGITQANQHQVNNALVVKKVDTMRDFVESIPTLTKDVVEFATARDWMQYDTPRNLGLAIMGEIGELCEILQFAAEDGEKPDNRLSTGIVKKLILELADIAIYTLRLANACNTTNDIWDALSTNTSL